ncbi:hypothetical protein RYX36_019808 [Vicia faba]
MAFYARSAISRALIFTIPSPFFHTKLVQYSRFSTSLFFSLTSTPISTIQSHSPNFNPIQRHFTSSNKNIDTKLNFSPSDSDSNSDEETTALTKPAPTSRKLPPPYDPFSKKPAIEEPKDPKDLQEIFHKMRSGDGLLNHAVKMFDALSKQGLTHEALELFGQIKDKGQMPDVVAHTAIIEAYANAGQPKEAHKAYMRMLASGVFPNAYTYTVLIRGLAVNDRFLKDARKYVVEMFEKGMRPNAETYTAVKLLEEMKGKGFVPDEKAVKEFLGNKKGPVFRTVITILFGK